MRINKFLAECGIASRRNCEALVLEGRVKVNNKRVLKLATDIDPENDLVSVDDGTLFQCKTIIKTVAYSNIAPCWFRFFNNLVRRCGNREKLFSCWRGNFLRNKIHPRVKAVGANRVTVEPFARKHRNGIKPL